VSYCLIGGGFPGTGNISANPLFVNQLGDFHINPGSPCVDAGDPTVFPPDARDVDGDPRRWYGGIDIGADEIASAALFGTGDAAGLLEVNGSSDPLAVLPVGSPLTIAVTQPASNPNPARFIVWGQIGHPTTQGEFATPFGNLVFAPFHLQPTVPGLFTLANSFGPDPSAFVPSSPATWTLAHPGLGFPFTFTLQGMVEVGPGPTNTVGITNAVVVEVR